MPILIAGFLGPGRHGRRRAGDRGGQAGMSNPGPHGFSEVLYAFASAGNNNGSAFAGLNANTPFYNTRCGLAMFFGRFGMMIPVLAIAGSLARKKHVPARRRDPAHRTAAVHRSCWSSVILIVGALTFFPALALGPIVEHLMMLAGVRPDHAHIHAWRDEVPAAVRPGHRQAGASGIRFTQARPRRTSCKQPGHVRGRVGSVLTTVPVLPGPGSGRGEAPPGSSWPSPLWLWFTVLFANFAEAMAEGRGKAQADDPAQGQRRRHRQAARQGASARRPSSRWRRRPAQGRRGPGGGRRHHPRRRRGHRGRGLGERGGHHRRIGPGHPRVRRRPQRGHRRHRGPLGLAGGARSRPTPARPSWTA